jgi:hypothetical protein
MMPVHFFCAGSPQTLIERAFSVRPGGIIEHGPERGERSTVQKMSRAEAR